MRDFTGWHSFQCGGGSFQVFRGPRGYYWAAGSPGCLYDGDPSGPFRSSFSAFCDAWNGGFGLDVERPQEVPAAKIASKALYWSMARLDDLLRELEGYAVEVEGNVVTAEIEGQTIKIILDGRGGYDARIVR